MTKVFDVNVFGMKVPVYLKDGLLKEKDIYGVSEFTKIRIVIDSSLNQKMFIHTLAHEMVHMMVHRLHLQISYDLEEQLCEIVIIPLLENLDVRLPAHLLKKLQAHSSQD